MLIEALQPLLVRLPGGDLHLQPGIPVELPEEQAARLLAKAHGKVRQALPRRAKDWLSAWREVAEISSGLTAEDPRLQPVRDALAACDVAFVADDWAAFQEARTGVLRAMQGPSTGERPKNQPSRKLS